MRKQVLLLNEPVITVEGTYMYESLSVDKAKSLIKERT